MWRSHRSDFGIGACTKCGHPNPQHFMWERGMEMMVGCHVCPNNTCHNTIEIQEETRSMSAVNLCERCDSLVLSKAVGTVSVRYSPTSGTHTMDLCPQCIEDFNAFVAESPKRGRDVFRNPFPLHPAMAIEGQTPEVADPHEPASDTNTSWNGWDGNEQPGFGR